LYRASRASASALSPASSAGPVKASAMIVVSGFGATASAAQSSTPGAVSNAASISSGETRKPPAVIRSSRRLP